MKTLACLLLVLVSAVAGDVPAPPEPVEPVPEPVPVPVPVPVPTRPPQPPPCSPNMACPRIWAPVCGCTCDGMYCRTFGNMCELRSYNCNNTPDFIIRWSGTCDQCPNEPVASA